MDVSGQGGSSVEGEMVGDQGQEIKETGRKHQGSEADAYREAFSQDGADH